MGEVSHSRTGRGGAAVISWADQNQTGLLIALVAVVLGIVALAFQTRRIVGQAFGMYRRNAWLFFKIGVMAVPIGLGFSGLAWLLQQFRPGSWVVEWFNNPGQASLASLFLATSFQYLAILLLVAPAAIAAVGALDQGQQPDANRCYLMVLRHIKPILICLVLLSVVTGFLISSIIGIVIAIFILVRWQFYPQGVLVSGAQDWKTALGFSREVVRHRWIPTLLNTIVFQAIAIVPGPLIGFLLMVWLHLSPVTADIISSLMYAVSVPIAVIGLTLYYLDERRNPYAGPPEAAVEQSGSLPDSGVSTGRATA